MVLCMLVLCLAHPLFTLPPVNGAERIDSETSALSAAEKA
jgi:hypothetical protein